jgi:uncharacterized protein
VRAQARRAEISGANRSFYCGAYWRYGFHEDGVVSALWALEDFGRTTGHAVAGATVAPYRRDAAAPPLSRPADGSRRPVAQLPLHRHRAASPACAAREPLSLPDLPDLPRPRRTAGVFDRFWLWSARRPALAWFKRSDFLGDPAVPLDVAVRDRVAARNGPSADGPIRLLTHMRYFGHNFNPVSFYYVFDAADSRLEYVVAEITNTPWDERHAYVLPPRRGRAGRRAGVALAVRASASTSRRSCRWTCATTGASPRQAIPHVHMDQPRGDAAPVRRDADAARASRSPREPRRALAAFPFITLKVSVLIYWQALRCWLKRTPFHPPGQDPWTPAPCTP